MTRRAQSNLVALVAALVLVGTALTATLAVAGGSFAAADRDPAAGQTAEAVGDGVVRAFGVPGRENAVSAPAMANLSAEELRERVPAARNRSVRVSLDGETLVAGDGGRASDERVVAVLTPRETANRSLVGGSATLPAGSAAAYLDPGAASRPAENGTERSVTEVRVDGRVVLADPNGLDGTYRVALPGPGPHLVRVSPAAVAGGSVRAVAYDERGAVLTVSTDA